MKQKRRRFSDDEKRAMIADWRASGKSRTAYAKDKGLAGSMFMRWLETLGSDSAPPPAPARAAPAQTDAFPVPKPRGRPPKNGNGHAAPRSELSPPPRVSAVQRLQEENFKLKAYIGEMYVTWREGHVLTAFLGDD